MTTQTEKLLDALKAEISRAVRAQCSDDYLIGLRSASNIIANHRTLNLSALDSDEAVESVAIAIYNNATRPTSIVANAAIQAVKGILGGKNEKE
jgi:hypothetical protein